MARRGTLETTQPMNEHDFSAEVEAAVERALDAGVAPETVANRLTRHANRARPTTEDRYATYEQRYGGMDD